MKKLHGIAGLLSKLSLVVLFAAGSPACIAQITDISQTELMHRIKANNSGLILDVRSAWEYSRGHIPGAVNIPHDQMDSRLAEIDAHKNKDIVLYCGSGRRVISAANTLQAAGFGKLLHLDGDMDGWLSNGKLPIKR